MSRKYTNDPSKISKTVDALFKDMEESADAHEKVVDAAKCYLRRMYYVECPEGERKSSGLWMPDKCEERGCCNLVHSYSRPQSLIDHCKTMKHIANLYGVKIKELRQQVKVFTETTKFPPDKDKCAKIIEAL